MTVVSPPKPQIERAGAFPRLTQNEQARLYLLAMEGKDAKLSQWAYTIR